MSLVLKDRFQLLRSYGHMMAPLMAEIVTDADLREAVYTQIGTPVTAIIENYLQAKMDAGQLRPANPVINSSIASLARSSRLGLTSSANMLVETSRTAITWTPR